MKIFYAVQATGNGHVSRAAQLYPHLLKHGTVDIFLSGNNCQLNLPFPVKYKSKGMSLKYTECGGLNFWQTVSNIHPLRVYREANALPLKKYDLVINDFEGITALGCRLQNISSVHFGHQASFLSDKTPRPDNKSRVGEFILKHFATSTRYVGLHFQPYDNFIFPPVIKPELLNGNVSNKDHVTVYLPSFQKKCLESTFSSLPHIQFHWFLGNVKMIHKRKNITYYPIEHSLFNNSLLNCYGLITGGGFETPSEALYLGKKLMSIPIANHYEQQCNAAAMRKFGVTVLRFVDAQFAVHIQKWYDSKIPYGTVEANNISETIECLLFKSTESN